jgi:hypothetical protein
VNKKTHHHGTELVLWFILWYNSLKIICHTFGKFWFALRHNFLGVCSALQNVCCVVYTWIFHHPPTALKSYLRRWDLLFKWGNDCVHLSSLSFASKHKFLIMIVSTYHHSLLHQNTNLSSWLCPLIIITLFCIKTQTCRHYSWQPTLFLLIGLRAQRAKNLNTNFCHHYSFDNLFFAFVKLSDTQKSC